LAVDANVAGLVGLDVPLMVPLNVEGDVAEKTAPFAGDEIAAAIVVAPKAGRAVTNIAPKATTPLTRVLPLRENRMLHLFPAQPHTSILGNLRTQVAEVTPNLYDVTLPTRP
jgi:hypothetical protein